MTREEEINIAAQCARIDIALKLSHYTDSIDKIDDVKEKLSFDEIAESAFIEGVKWSDENPKSPWISIKDDLPCNHEELICSGDKNLTLFVIALVHSFVVLNRMEKIEGEWHWTTDEPSHWFAIPELPKE